MYPKMLDAGTIKSNCGNYIRQKIKSCWREKREVGE